MAEGRGEPRSDSPQQFSASVPVIDLRLLSQSDGSSQEEMAKLRSALGSWGLFQLTGHGIPACFLDEVRRSGTQFLELPVEEKQRYACKGEGFAQGYGRDLVDTRAHAADWTDRILLQVEPEDQRELELWPENPSSFREIIPDFSARSKAAVQLVLRAMAKSLDLEETHFLGQFGESMVTYCRVCHYPSSSRPDLNLGLRPHSDNTGLTVILQGDVGGLEVLKDDEGAWVKVPNNPDVLLFMMGDLMEIMSNGMFKSRMHRVVAHPEKTRFSTILFYSLDPEKEIGPPEKLLREGKIRLYRDLKVKDYLDAHLRSFTEGKTSLDWAKI